MKRFMKWMFIGIAAFGLSLGAMAGVSDTGAYLGIAQTFAGMTDTYVGYTFGNVTQTSAFTVQFDVNDVFGVGVLTLPGTPFLLQSTLGFGLLYEYEVSALDLNIYANTQLNAGNTNFANWDAGARAEFLVLPNPCDAPGPCYNPELKIFAEIGLTQNFLLAWPANLPAVWGEVGFEIHL